MEEAVSQEKNQHLIKIFSWTIIVLSTLSLIWNFLLSNGYLSMFKMQIITKNFDPPVEINFTLYFFQKAIEFLFCVVLFISATFLLRYKNVWRKTLLYSLVTLIIYLVLLPIINYYNFNRVMRGVDVTSRFIWAYMWSIILSAISLFIILKLSKDEVKRLFK